MLLSNAAHGCAPGRRRSKRIATRALRSAPPNPVEPPLEQPVEGEGSTIATEISALPIAPVPVPDTEIGYLPGVAAVETLKVRDRKSTRLNSSHTVTSYAVFCLKKKR